MRLPFSLLPYVRHIKRLFAGPGTLQSTAYRQEILCPEEKATFLPAIYLEGQLERVTGSPVESTKETEIATATSLTRTLPATISYHFNDVALVDGSIYVNSLRFFLADEKQFTSSRDAVCHLECAALASTYYGMKYFGHWLSDDCTSHLLATELGIPPLCLPTAVRPHAKSYASLFQQDWTPTVRGRIDHLTIFQDFSQNSLKLKRYQALRNHVGSHFPHKTHRLFVYLKRGKSGSPRVIQNEHEIIEALLKHGFIVVDSETDRVEELLEVLVNAKIVVSIEGSHIAHCIFAVPRETALLVLQPCDRFAANHREWCNCLDVRFGFVVGSVGESGYLFGISEILRTIDLMLASLDS